MPLLAQLLKAELAEREVRSIAYRIKSARFPACKDLAGFDFAARQATKAIQRSGPTRAINRRRRFARSVAVYSAA